MLISFWNYVDKGCSFGFKNGSGKYDLAFPKILKGTFFGTPCRQKDMYLHGYNDNVYIEIER